MIWPRGLDVTRDFVCATICTLDNYCITNGVLNFVFRSRLLSESSHRPSDLSIFDWVDRFPEKNGTLETIIGHTAICKMHI